MCAIASELLGLRPDDAAGARWAVRGFLALLLWPVPDGDESAAATALVAGLGPR